MTDEEIHNIYLHMSGKAEGLVEATGKADFPVLFARAILDYEGLRKDEPVAWGMETDGLIYDVICPAEHNREEGEYTIPLYTHPKEWVGLTDEDDVDWEEGDSLKDLFKAIEAKLKEKNGY
jgi:hypothetical protein